MHIFDIFTLLVKCIEMHFLHIKSLVEDMGMDNVHQEFVIVHKWPEIGRLSGMNFNRKWCKSMLNARPYHSIKKSVKKNYQLKSQSFCFQQNFCDARTRRNKAQVNQTGSC